MFRWEWTDDVAKLDHNQARVLKAPMGPTYCSYPTIAARTTARVQRGPSTRAFWQAMAQPPIRMAPMGHGPIYGHELPKHILNFWAPAQAGTWTLHGQAPGPCMDRHLDPALAGTSILHRQATGSCIGRQLKVGVTEAHAHDWLKFLL